MASILRLALLFNENLADPTCKTSSKVKHLSFLIVDADGLVNAFTWSNIEVDVAVLSASLPTLRPVFQKMWPSLRMITYGRTGGKGLGRSDGSDRAFAMPEIIDRPPRKNFQSLDDDNGYSVTSVTAHGDLEQGKEHFGGIHVKREVQNDFEHL